MLNGYCCCFDCFRLAASDLPIKMCKPIDAKSVKISKINLTFQLPILKKMFCLICINTLYTQNIQNLSLILCILVILLQYDFIFFQFTVLYVSFCTHFMSIIAKKNMVPFSQPALNALDTFG